jgi:hypothetical protein
MSGSQFPLADGSFPLRDLPNASRRWLTARPPRIAGRASAKRLKCQHFTSARFHRGRILAADHDDPGEDPMFEQTIGGTLRNIAIGLVLTAAVVGAAFALAFS